LLFTTNTLKTTKLKKATVLKMGSLFYFINDTFLPAEEAALPVTDLAIQRGYGVFDFLRTENHQPVFLLEHLERFYQSAAGLHLTVPISKEELKNILLELIRRNDLPSSGIKMTLTGGDAPNGYQPTEPNLIITQQPLTLPTEAHFEKGISLITYEHQRQLPQIKTIDYLMAIWLQPHIKQQGADDVLYYQNNTVTECPRANIFMVTNEDAVLTPKKNVLNGITRGKIIEAATTHFPVIEKDILLEDLKAAKEVFITSSTKKVLPVMQVDEVIFNNKKPGPVTIQIAQLFNTLLQS
jgi:D-alanine transaminase/branched-chain amino acid aminotransferase